MGNYKRGLDEKEGQKTLLHFERKDALLVCQTNACWSVNKLSSEKKSKTLTPDTVVVRVPPATVSEMDIFKFSITTPNSDKKDKDYECEAATLNEMQEWVSALQVAATGTGGATQHKTSTDPANTLTCAVPAGPIDEAHLDGPVNLMSYAWFHGTMSSDEAFKILETLPVGAYLVRVSKSRPASFVVSYVADADKVIHVVWEWDTQLGWTADGQPNGFDTVPEIWRFTV